MLFQVTGILLLCRVGFSLATREEFHRMGKNVQQLENSEQETLTDNEHSFVLEPQNKKQLIKEILSNKNVIIANHYRIKRESSSLGKSFGRKGKLQDESVDLPMENHENTAAKRKQIKGSSDLPEEYYEAPRRGNIDRYFDSPRRDAASRSGAKTVDDELYDPDPVIGFDQHLNTSERKNFSRVRSINELGRSPSSNEIGFTTAFGVRLTVSTTLLFASLLKWFF